MHSNQLGNTKALEGPLSRFSWTTSNLPADGIFLVTSILMPSITIMRSFRFQVTFACRTLSRYFIKLWTWPNTNTSYCVWSRLVGHMLCRSNISSATEEQKTRVWSASNRKQAHLALSTVSKLFIQKSQWFVLIQEILVTLKRLSSILAVKWKPNLVIVRLPRWFSRLPFTIESMQNRAILQTQIRITFDTNGFLHDMIWCTVFDECQHAT